MSNQTVSANKPVHCRDYLIDVAINQIGNRIDNPVGDGSFGQMQ